MSNKEPIVAGSHQPLDQVEQIISSHYREEALHRHREAESTRLRSPQPSGTAHRTDEWELNSALLTMAIYAAGKGRELFSEGTTNSHFRFDMERRSISRSPKSSIGEVVPDLVDMDSPLPFAYVAYATGTICAQIADAFSTSKEAATLAELYPPPVGEDHFTDWMADERGVGQCLMDQGYECNLDRHSGQPQASDVQFVERYRGRAQVFYSGLNSQMSWQPLTELLVHFLSRGVCPVLEAAHLAVKMPALESPSQADSTKHEGSFPPGAGCNLDAFSHKSTTNATEKQKETIMRVGRRLLKVHSGYLQLLPPHGAMAFPTAFPEAGTERKVLVEALLSILRSKAHVYRESVKLMQEPAGRRRRTKRATSLAKLNIDDIGTFLSAIHLQKDADGDWTVEFQLPTTQPVQSRGEYMYSLITVNSWQNVSESAAQLFYSALAVLFTAANGSRVYLVTETLRVGLLFAMVRHFVGRWKYETDKNMHLLDPSSVGPSDIKSFLSSVMDYSSAPPVKLMLGAYTDVRMHGKYGGTTTLSNRRTIRVHARECENNSS